MDWRQARKAVVALAGTVGQALNAGLVPEEWRPWVAIGLAVATALGVYAAPNDPAPGGVR
jgi:hypothetical protein